MDNDSGVEKFALGLIVAVIVFLLLRREIGHAAAGELSGDRSGVDAGGAGGSCASCKTCGNANPVVKSGKVVSIGAQSLNDGGGAYDAASVVSASNKNSIPDWLSSTGNSLF